MKCVLLCMLAGLSCLSWGFFAHRKINTLAVYSLPAAMSRFFKSNITYLGEHATDADKRRYADTLEAARHYLDAEEYGNLDSMPMRYDEARKRFGEKMLQKNGIVPWQIHFSHLQLVAAFRSRDSLKILRTAANLGHYIADAHVPLHLTNNHNGQLSNQKGIHAFWESRLPELFSAGYSFYTGPARYIENPLREAWRIVRQTRTKVDSVLRLEAELKKRYPSDQQFSFYRDKKQVIRAYSLQYSRAYHEKLNGMVERQMRASIAAVAGFWYTAWVDAGQPDLQHLKHLPHPARAADEATEQAFNKGKILGREL
ncbi:S1/P1 Nuclease [Pedobacter yulinensis]|uniref:S1/P1 Nuclease n=1 Tax=Pedobacter yulinensis TaxID=2126353 RepID=A0A2T3HH68_9SPHI|nr:zinc dependent phospholipase C family protein [Pedobacter yulinensis]PST81743.1 S1/P1 Nuclease [Pedobacter yulinensis]